MIKNKLHKEVHVLEEVDGKLEWLVKVRTDSLAVANEVLKKFLHAPMTIRAEIHTVTESGNIFRGNVPERVY